MKSKITYIVIGAVIIFWIGFLGWGMFKTSLKLSKEKAAVPETKKTEEEAVGAAVTAKGSAVSTEAPTAPVEPRAILVRTFKTKTSDFQDILPVMGTVKGKTEIQLKFEINGVVQKINFREGEKIKAGDLIASLDPKDAELKLSYAKNKFNSAQSEYNSVQKKLEVHQKLFEAGAIIKSKFEEVELECESAKYQVETARSEMDLANNELKKTSLYATKDGVMGKREAEEGEFLTPQDKLGALYEIGEVFVEVGVVERDISKIKIGQKAKIFVDAQPGVIFEGVVENIFPVIEGKSRTLTVKIKVPNAESLLLPGMFSRAEILITELKDAIIVPANCLIAAGKGITLVPVIPQQTIQKTEEETQVGTVQLRRVTTGYLTSDYAQITEGVKAGDLVVIETQGELKDNAAVKIIGIEEASF